MTKFSIREAALPGAAVTVTNTPCRVFVRHALPHRSERRQRRDLACIEAVGVSGVGKEALGVRGVVRMRLDAQGELHDTWYDRSGQAREAQALGLVEGLLVDRH